MKMITSLAVSNVKKNRTRSILIMISIFMTTLLLTAIGTMGNGLIRHEKTNAEILYGSYYGTFGGVKEENIREMERRSEFTDIGRMAALGEIEGDGNFSLIYADDKARSMTNLKQKLKEGSFPEKENEIAAQPEFFRKLGLKNPKVGDAVTISYRRGLDTPYEAQDFIISGLLEDLENEETVNGAAGYVSEACYNERVPAKDRAYTIYFRLDETISFSEDEAEDYFKELAEKCGIDERYVSDNYAYLMWTMNPGWETIAGCVMIGLLVILFSVVVIYNIFQVGITQKIQEYGKIKALGATKKQIRHLIKKEGQILAALSIPPGIVAGYLVAELGFGFLYREMPVEGMERVSLISVWVPLFMALLSYFTMRFALLRPCRIVASISPVEAVRYQENTIGKQSIRRGKKSLSVKGMTLANLAGNRRRTISTIVSMGLSCVLFVVIANFVGNIDVEYDARRSVSHGQFQLELSYAMNDKVYPERNLDSILEENPLGSKMLKKIEEIPGVTEVRTRKICYAVLPEREAEPVSVVVIDKEDFDRELEHGGLLGAFTYEEVSEKNGIIYGYSYWMEESGFEVGEEINLELYDGTKCAGWNGVIMGAFGSAGGDFVVTEDTYQNLGLEGDNIYDIWVDCKEADRAQVETELRELLSGVSNVELDSYEKAYELSFSAARIMMLGGYLLGALVTVISFLNMANTLITSIVTRKQEFGILQAIGMTNRQLNYSLQLEGIFFTAGTVLVSAIVGIPLGYGVFCYGAANGWIGMYHYHFPWLEILLLIAALALLQTVLSFVLSRNVKKESLVERIRYQE